MRKELEKTYNPKDIEDRLYTKWLDKKYFHAVVDKDKEPFTIVIPPPNITGQLHMGHALDNTMQDVIIRMKRMQGYNALWQPGMDHASIATEVKVIEQLKKEGVDARELGREKFLERAWAWKEEYGGRIIEQLKKLGSSCDWERTRFTMDEGCSDAVFDVFVKLYKKGYIYKGSKIINWCPVCKTSISDAEVVHKERSGHFWHIRYPVVGTDEFLCIATTRPETMLGDTAVAVHPEDERYQRFIGKRVALPLMNREIPIIADEYVDRDFGTGVVKITPAHDPNDFEVGKRHDLPEVNVMNDDASINENGGKYHGMDRYEARKQIVKDLEGLGLLIKIEDHEHNVGTHDRCDATVEPLIKMQWFVRMDEMIRPAVDAVRTGEIRLVPERMDKLYYNWTDNIRDWCISRQLWWGHRIPAYYCKECGEMVVSKEKPMACVCGCKDMVQDEDTLDTWFSSALWPFCTLGWPQDTEDYRYFYPTNVLVTGYDIIFFWVIRMIFSGYEQTGKKPFDTVLFHGLIRDSEGRKMSKSLGNGIDPLDVIGQYGADALRMTLVTGNAPGNDMRFYWERVEASRNFANKVWNASRFIMMNEDDGWNGGNISTETAMPDNLAREDKWILSKANALVRDVTANMENYELGVAVQNVYDFIWEEFCDWYIEMVKPRLYDKEDETRDAALWTLRRVLIQGLKLLHPYMPFVTEEIYCTLLGDEEASIMVSEWPKYDAAYDFEREEGEIELIKEAIKGMRNIRAEMNVPQGKKGKAYLVASDERVRALYEDGATFLTTLGGAGTIVIREDEGEEMGKDAMSAVLSKAVVYMPFSELVDVKKERERLEKEKARLLGEVARVNGMLGNERFLSKAPPKKVEEEEAKKVKYTEMLAQVEERLAKM